MKVEIFEPEDLLLLEPRDLQVRDLPAGRLLEHGQRFKEGGSAFTAWETLPDGRRPVFCGGAVRLHGEFVELWGLFSRHRSRVPMFLTRAVRSFIAGRSERRVAATVSGSDPGACGWARLVGLEEEARLHAAMPDGTDMVVFVRAGLLRGPTAPLHEGQL